jgi:acyl-coenzyme A synthetase/AMP-(fatty) acid ligase
LVTYRELDREVGATADALRVPGIRAGDRMMLVSEKLDPARLCPKLAESQRN